MDNKYKWRSAPSIMAWANMHTSF